MDASSRGSRLLRGILDACLLALVGERDRYGYEIAAALRACGLTLVRDGSIYPLLARLERRGHLTSYLVPAASGPRRRYYKITPRGRAELDGAILTWNQMSEGVDAILWRDRNDDET